MKSKMKLEVVIETDGKYCGDDCPLCQPHNHCGGAPLRFDWQARRHLRHECCKSKAVECPE